VKAKRLDHGRAFVVGRSGAFLELSKTLFCKLDDFDESEVISCVTNVYEAQLAARKLKKRRQ
jgi:hypothetical protein